MLLRVTTPADLAVARDLFAEYAASIAHMCCASFESQGLDAELATAALEELPLAEREVVVTRLWGELSFQEIGDLVGCSSSAAQRRYVAALAALRERFGVRCSTTKDCPKN